MWRNKKTTSMKEPTEVNLGFITSMLLIFGGMVLLGTLDVIIKRLDTIISLLK